MMAHIKTRPFLLKVDASLSCLLPPPAFACELETTRTKLQGEPEKGVQATTSFGAEQRFRRGAFVRARRKSLPENSLKSGSEIFLFPTTILGNQSAVQLL